MRLQSTISRLCEHHELPADDYQALLTTDDAESMAFLHNEAQRVTENVFGRNVYIRGLLEISNHCRNNCHYCGIRKGNSNLHRYRLSKSEIIESCMIGYERGFRTFVLQGGEDPAQTTDWLVDVVTTLHSKFPNCAITLSLGEKSYVDYERLRLAGAERYLLRHETYDPIHYAQLHPEEMSRDRRLQCLRSLKSLGYQTGAGMMVGSPYQTVDNLVEDLLFIQQFTPEMIGIGPFIAHHDTPFHNFPNGSPLFTLRLISILRLMHPHALIPATTALATLLSDGHTRGIMAGANVIMPNLTPAGVRNDYALYDHKAGYGAESVEGLDLLRAELSKIDYTIKIGRGDYSPTCLFPRPSPVGKRKCG